VCGDYHGAHAGIVMDVIKRRMQFRNQAF